MTDVIKISSRGTQDFWEIPVLYEDEHLLALDKPAGLLCSPDRGDPNRLSLIKLLHSGITEAKAWATQRGLTYLMNAHRLDAEASGVLLLAKKKPVLVALANLFGSEKPSLRYLALVRGNPQENRFETAAKLSPHPAHLGQMRVDSQNGKRARTIFEVLERFTRWTLLQCQPLPGRPHQVRVHLASLALPVTGDSLYRGKPLFLSSLKKEYRLKPNQVERPLISLAALHAHELELVHPLTNERLKVTSPWPKDLLVAVKYLRRYALGAPEKDFP